MKERVVSRRPHRTSLSLRGALCALLCLIGTTGVASSAGAGPLATLSAYRLDFAPQTIGSTSEPQTLSLTNTGDAALNISSIAVNSADFTLTAGSGPGALPPGGTREIEVRYCPRNTGRRTALLTISSDAPNSPLAVGLFGAEDGRPTPLVFMAPSLGVFGFAPVGGSASIRMYIANHGTAPLSIESVTLAGADAGDFQIDSGGGAGILQPGTQRELDISLWPSAPGSRSAYLVFDDDAPGSPHTFAMVSSASPADSLRVTPDTLDFGEQPEGTTSTPLTVTLTNTGTGPVSTVGLALSGPSPQHFALVDPSPGVIEPGESRTVSVLFSPLEDGGTSREVAARLDIADNASTAGQPVLSVLLRGMMTTPQVQLTPSLAFGDQPGGTSSPPQSMTVTNAGEAPLVVLGWVLHGPNADAFTVQGEDALGRILAPGASGSLSVVFTPTAPGGDTARLSVDTNAIDLPGPVDLSGTGTVPVLRLSATTLPFGQEPVGLNGTLALLLQNTGSAPLDVSRVGFQGADAAEFALVPGGWSGGTLQPGEIGLLNVRFSPIDTGSRSATLVITDDAPDSPQSVTLTGTGTAPLLTLSAASLLFGLQSSSTQTLTLTNNGDAPLLIDALTMAGPDAGHFQIVSDTGEASLAVGSSRTVQIAFQSATVAGAPRHGTAHIAATSYSASLEIKDNDPHPTSLHAVALIASSSVGTSSDTTPPPTTGSAPAAPSGLTAQVRSATEIDLTWTDNSSNEDAFAVWRQDGSGDWTRVGVVIPNRTHFEDRTVTPGNSYTYRVRATTGHFASDWSSTVTVTTSPVPATPSGLTATVSAGPQVQLTWHNPQPDARLSLTVWRQEGSGPWTRVAVLPGDATTFTDSTVAVNGSYRYQVHLVDGAAGSPWSNLAHASTSGMALAAPSGLTATVGGGPQVRLSWSVSAPNPHAYLTLWRQAAGGEWTRVALLRGNVTRFTDTSVQPGTSYTYHAHLVTDPAVSAWSNTATVSTPTAGPGQLTATAAPGGKVVLTWSNPHPDTRAWVTVWRQAGSGEWTRVALLHGDAASFTDTQVSAGTSYRYRAHRVDGADVSDWSNEAAVVLP